MTDAAKCQSCSFYGFWVSDGENVIQRKNIIIITVDVNVKNQ